MIMYPRFRPTTPVNIRVGWVLACLILGAMVLQVTADGWTGVLFRVSVSVAMVTLLAQAYGLLSGSGELHRSGRNYWTAHIVLHLVPLSYLFVAATTHRNALLEVIYILPLMFFFLTGFRTWRICSELFARRLYKIFTIGNIQMLVYFPATVVLDLFGKDGGASNAFFWVMQGYFSLHFALTAVTVVILQGDIRRREGAASDQQRPRPPSISRTD